MGDLGTESPQWESIGGVALGRGTRFWSLVGCDLLLSGSLLYVRGLSYLVRVPSVDGVPVGSELDPTGGVAWEGGLCV